MRKKNGFTLVELLSTVVILGVVLSVTVYIVMKNINKAKDNADLITYNNIKSAAKVYNDEVASYWNIKDDYEYSCISLGNMIEIGYFDENIINKSDKLSKDTMLKVIRDKDSKVIKETSFSFEDSILPDVDCGYQSSVLISTDNKGKKVKTTNAKIIFNGLNGNYYRYFNLSGFSENTITTNDVVYACEGIGNCSNNTVNNLESGHWYLASSDVVRLSVKSNGVISAFVNSNGENVAEATKNIDFIDNTPPVISLGVYKIGSYEGNNPKTKGDLITTISGNYVDNEWKNYGYWFDISTNEDSEITWAYNNEGSINGGSPSNSGANCNSPCSKTLSGDGNRKATIIATDEAGNSSTIDVSIYIDRTTPTCTLSANASTITASASDDDGGSGLAYYGWDSSYSGSNSASKSIATGTHTYYVKDGAGNTNSCSITIMGTTAYCATSGYSIDGSKCTKKENALSVYKATGWCRCESNSGSDIEDTGCYMGNVGVKSSYACSSCPSGYYLKENHCSSSFYYYWCRSGTRDGSMCIFTKSISYKCSDNSYTQINDSYCYK